MKSYILLYAGLIGSFIASLFGGWSSVMTTLLIFMAIDFLTGVIVAGIFKKSDKTSGGALSSKAGFRGICKKCVIMLFVLIGARLDVTLGVTYIKDGVCTAFIINEILSVIENAGLMGIPVPSVIKKAVELLETKGEEK